MWVAICGMYTEGYRAIFGVRPEMLQGKNHHLYVYTRHPRPYHRRILLLFLWNSIQPPLGLCGLPESFKRKVWTPAALTLPT